MRLLGGKIKRLVFAVLIKINPEHLCATDNINQVMLTTRKGPVRGGGVKKSLEFGRKLLLCQKVLIKTFAITLI